MTAESLSSNEFLNFTLETQFTGLVPHERINTGTVTATVVSLVNASCPQSSQPNVYFHEHECVGSERQPGESLVGQCLRRRRRKRARFYSNKGSETQRMTHIAVERNRRKKMNEHLAVLKSLMPESYVQRSDQASIVGGAIEFVKMLEHIMNSLEAKKLLVQELNKPIISEDARLLLPSFSQFFVKSQMPSKFVAKSKPSMANIEVTLIETHAHLRILSRTRPTQLSKLVAALNSLHLSVLHINVTVIDRSVVYSISTKLDEQCQLRKVDEITRAVHHVLGTVDLAD